MPSIVASVELGMAPVVATDGDDDVLDLLRHNAEINARAKREAKREAEAGTEKGEKEKEKKKKKKKKEKKKKKRKREREEEEDTEGGPRPPRISRLLWGEKDDPLASIGLGTSAAAPDVLLAADVVCELRAALSQPGLPVFCFLFCFPRKPILTNLTKTTTTTTTTTTSTTNQTATTAKSGARS